MRRRWSSVRFRRRFYAIGGTLTVVTSVVVAAALIGNTATPQPDTLRPGKPWVYHEPVKAKLLGLDRRSALDTSLLFINTAVARKHLDVAYRLAAPELRQGMSKGEWMHGDIPVVPFPVLAVAQYSLAYSYRNDVAFQFSLLARPGTGSTVVGKTFTIELKRPRTHAPWRVVSWSPTGISGVTNDLAQAITASKRPPPPEGSLSLYWLLLPLGMLASIVLVPTALGVRGWYLGRKFERQYLAERGYE